jgi:diguanylate cyclase (GGDEF)-like protein/PAS domain S-box-containing protein
LRKKSDERPAGGILCHNAPGEFKGELVADRGSPKALESESLFRSLVANIPGAVYRCEPEAPWRMHLMTDAIEDIAGFPAADFLSGRRTYGSLVLPEDLPGVEAQIDAAVRAGAAYTLEYRIRHRDGSVRWVYEKGRGVLWDDGRLLWLDGVILDITARKKAEETMDRLNDRLVEAHLQLREANEKLAREAVTDTLTGIANRRALEEHLRRAVAEARRGRPFALLAIDVDGFKAYNDTLGHPAGDAALVALARALGGALRDSDLLARAGGDEFCAVLAGADEPAALAAAERLRRAAEAVVGLPRPIAVTLGVAAWEPEEESLEALRQAADDALYAAKRAGRNRVCGRRSG